MTSATKNRQKGFTLIELVIVIAVIAILVTISTLGYTLVRDKARDAAITTEMTRASQELASYNIANQNRYPATLAEINVTSSDGVTLIYTRTADHKGYQLTGAKDNATFILRHTDQAPQKQ